MGLGSRDVSAGGVIAGVGSAGVSGAGTVLGGEAVAEP
jgi:hypothetical protein